jgi:hypothetical protein
MSPFNLYQQAHRATTAEEVTAVGSVHERHIVGKDGHEINNFVNRLLGKKWKQLQEEERLPYYFHSERDKLRFKREVAARDDPTAGRQPVGVNPAQPACASPAKSSDGSVWLATAGSHGDCYCPAAVFLDLQHLCQVSPGFTSCIRARLMLHCAHVRVIQIALDDAG